MTRTFTARYSGRCALCPHPIQPGMLVTGWPGARAHSSCVTREQVLAGGTFRFPSARRRGRRREPRR